MNYKDENILYDLYITKNMGVGEIAKYFDVNIHTISRWISKFGLIKLYNDGNWLREKYESGLSTTDIAKLCNVETSTINRNLAKYNIITRSVSDGNKAKWSDEAHRNKMLAKFRSDSHRNKLRRIWTDNCRDFQSQRQSEVWKNGEYRERQIATQKQWWSDPANQERMAEIFDSEQWRGNNAIARANMPKISSIQLLLYSLLDDLGVRYFRERDNSTDLECIIGPWAFDCAIPRANKPTLLIECQGDYFHNTTRQILRDKQKATYLSSLPQYELKYLWEHEFKNHEKIADLLKYWLGISSVENIDFNFEDVVIKDCPAVDYRLLLSKYHYLANAGRGGIAYGAYLNNELIAVCVFSPLPRQNISIDDIKNNQVRELSRFCINPKYQKRNFATWMISRCMKLLPDTYKAIIAYADNTFNHDGTIYKAANFILDGTVPADYWYVGKDGWKMHKKTLYNHAKKMGVTEREYAESNGYVKIHGREKNRYKFIR